LHSLINIIPRRKPNGDIYYQARFFDKAGHPLTARSYSDAKCPAAAYSLARKEIENGLLPSLAREEAENYELLTGDEIKAILDMSPEKPGLFRSQVIVLLGITCGLGVTELSNLKFDDVIFERDMLKTGTADTTHIIPVFPRVMKKITAMRGKYPDSLYVIPNLKDMKKPCDPITISRGLSAILLELKIPKERNIVFSCLKNNFLSLLLDLSENKNISLETIDNLCGFSKRKSQDENLSDEINAMQHLQVKLEQLQYNTLGDSKWHNKSSNSGHEL
jgi:integrase